MDGIRILDAEALVAQFEKDAAILRLAADAPGYDGAAARFILKLAPPFLEAMAAECNNLTDPRETYMAVANALANLLTQTIVQLVGGSPFDRQRALAWSLKLIEDAAGPALAGQHVVINPPAVRQ